MNFFRYFFATADQSTLDWDVFVAQGADAASYIERQTTNSLSFKTARFNSVLDVKGRLIAYFLQFYYQEQIYILVPSKLKQRLEDRLLKYCVSEDFTLCEVDLRYYIGSYQSEGIRLDGFDCSLSVVISKNLPTSDHILNYFYSLGIPNEKLVLEQPLFTDTSLFAYAYDPKKGCFPGQEVVGKIASRRGASYASVIVETDIFWNIDQVLRDQNGRKIAVVRYRSDQNFYVLDLIRDYRIHQSRVDFYWEPSQKVTLSIFLISKIPLNFSEKCSFLYDQALQEHTVRNNSDLAITYLNNLLALNPTHNDGWEVLAVIYGKLENYDLAINTAKRHLAVDPDSVMAHTNLSFFYMRQGNISAAEEEKALATVASFKKLGEESKIKKAMQEQEREREKQLSQKERMFKQVLEIDPNDQLANIGLAEIAFNREQFSEVVNMLENFYHQGQKSSKLFLLIGKSYLKMNQNERAFSYLKEGSQWAAKMGELQPANEMQALIVQAQS